MIEHCFISNASDRSNFLSSESKIKSLGVADANGIADYLGINSNSLRQYSDGTGIYTETVRLTEVIMA